MKRMMTLALALMITGFGRPDAASADDPPGQLDRSKTKKAIEAAEERMAEYCYGHPLEKKKADNGSYEPNFVADPDNPLIGKIGVFRGRFDKNDDEVIIYNEPILVGAKPEDQPSRVVKGTFKARELKKLYDYSRLYDRHRMLKSKYDEQVKELRHTIKIKLPSGLEMPEKTHNHFKATLRITGVEWDHGALLPTLVFHTELIESKDFGLELD